MSSQLRGGGLALIRDFRLLLYLFIGFRLLMLVVYQPLVVSGVERGVTAGGDFGFYHSLASLTDDGLLPYRDYWYEFPPLWTGLMLAVYRVAPAYTAFASLLGLLFIAFDAGCFVLLKRLGGRLHGSDSGIALAWIYALLLAPAVFVWWDFEAIVAFAVLLSLWWLVVGEDDRSAGAALVGALVKFVPLLALGAVWRFRPWRAALRYTLISLGGIVAVFAVLIALTGPLGSASLLAQYGKASYGTVWALLDGNMTTGIFGAIDARFDPANATVVAGNPAVIPSWLRLIPFGLIGLYAFLQTRRRDSLGLVSFVTLTLLIFFLWSQGWSPQWLALIIPLVLLNFPDRQGVLVVLLLSMIAFAEYPLLFMRTGDTGGVITGSLVPAFVALVLARTGILSGLAWALLKRLRIPE